MSVLGSVFLGDAQRSRVLSPQATSPPTSPQPTGLNAPVHIDPELSLSLRIRWLEVLLLGIKAEEGCDVSNEKAKKKKKAGSQATAAENTAGASNSGEKGMTLVRRAEELQKKLDSIVQSNDSLKKLMDRFDQHSQILTPTFGSSGLMSPPTYSSMTSEEFDAFLAETEPDIRAADRDFREIDILEKRGVLSAGKLTDYEAIVPRLNALKSAYEEDMATAVELERRVANVLKQYSTRIDALSELFVEWNDMLSAAEDKIARLERERVEKARLGFEE